jgi:hypothetical protein
MRRVLAALVVAAATPAAATVLPNGPDLGAVCLAAADAAADAAGVPRAVLRALTRTETGRTRGGTLQPWPWTVNMEGAGHWFETRAEALAYVEREQARGARSFDVGCFQINHRWHGQHFASVDAMFDPATNAAYAARFMGELFAETGDWSRAAGFYHSRTPEFYNRYRSRFDRLRAAAEAETGTAVASAPPPEAPKAPKVRLPRTSTETLAAVTTAWHESESAGQSPGGVAIRLLQGREAAPRGLLVASTGSPLLRGTGAPLFGRGD